MGRPISMDISMDIPMDIHEKICGYGCGYGWVISYPRQAWIISEAPGVKTQLEWRNSPIR